MKTYDELAYYRERKKLMALGHSQVCAERRLKNWDWLKEFKSRPSVMGEMQLYIDSMVYEG